MANAYIAVILPQCLQIQDFCWNSKAFWGVLVAAAISLAGLLAVEKRTEHPVLPGSFMKRGAFILSVLALFLTQGLMQANMTNTIVFVNYTQPDDSAGSGSGKESAKFFDFSYLRPHGKESML